MNFIPHHKNVFHKVYTDMNFFPPYLDVAKAPTAMNFIPHHENVFYKVHTDVNVFPPYLDLAKAPTAVNFIPTKRTSSTRATRT